MTEIKPNDKAIDAARAAILKAMAERNCIIAGVPFNETNYDEFDASEVVEFSKVALDAAYAAQFQSEDYAGLVKELRERAGSYDSHDYHEEIELKAADALEALLAERDALNFELAARKEWPQARAEMLDELAKVRAERDALAARLAPVDDEALAERDELKGVIQSYQILLETQQGMFVAVQAERDALAARLAPVEDEALVEIAVKEVEKVIASANDSDTVGGARWKALRAAIAAIRPHIEAAEREKCQKMLARMGAGTPKTGAVNE